MSAWPDFQSITIGL